MRIRFERFNTTDRRYHTAAIAGLVSQVAGTDYVGWFGRYVEGTEPLPANAGGLATPP